MLELFALGCVIYVIILYLQLITLSGPYKHWRSTEKNEVKDGPFEFDDKELIEWAKDIDLI